MYKLTFEYDNRGYGELIVWQDEGVLDHWACRTGSLDAAGLLKNAIPCETWLVKGPSVATTEIACVVKGYGRKIRLWRLIRGMWTYTRYLFHPDGRLPGTEGCVAPIRSTPVERLKELFALLDRICAEQEIMLEVTCIKS
jgi:hypothetical protein